MRIEHWIYAAPLRLRSLFRTRQVEQELDEELQFHVDRKTEEYIAQGLTPAQARASALRSMDGLTRHKEECREARRVEFIGNAVRDLRYAVRLLRKSPGFTAVAVVTLALAIGANALVFGIFNGLSLRPLNVPQAESLYGLEHGNEHSMYESYPDYRDLRDRNRSFDGLAGFTITEAGLDTGGNSTRAWGYDVTGNYFDVLRTQPYLGRLLHAGDEHGPNSAPWMVLSYGYWHSHFHDDRAVVGRRVELNKRPFTIVGVAPPEFRGTLVFGSPSFFVPIVQQEQIDGQSPLNARGTQLIFMTFGHLKAGVTPAQAEADLNSVGTWIEKAYPNDHGTTSFKLARPNLYGNYMGGPVRAFLLALTLLAGLILLAACANLGSLFAARAADRSREVALRLALGSSRSRILRTLFTEAMLISLMGGAAGLWGSVALLRTLSQWQPIPKFPLVVPVTPDARVYVVAVLLAVVSGILFGIVPVRQVLRTDPYQIVKAGRSGRPGRRITVRDMLLVVQVAICAVLVTSSMVAVRGLVRSMNSNFGFDPRNVMTATSFLTMAGYHGDAAAAMQKRMLEAMERIPGVQAAGLVDEAPLTTGGGTDAAVYAESATDLRPGNALASAVRYRISPGYLKAAGTVLLAGRDFSLHDDRNAPRVAVVNLRFAAKVFGSGVKAVGRVFKLRSGTRVEVVGVVEDGKYIHLTEDPLPALFVPMLQSPTTDTALVVRSARQPEGLAAEMRSRLRELDSGLPVEIETWNQGLDLPLFPSRVATVSLGVLGVMGAMLAITGIFGLAAYSVSRRLKELGIRMALGAQRGEMLQAGLGRPLKLLAFGGAAGLVLGILSSRLLGFIVYEATPRDPLVLGGVVLALLLMGVLATWIPAHRALSLNPLTLLREE